MVTFNRQISRRILTILTIGLVAYAVSSVLAYLVAVKVPISVTILSIQIGFVPCMIIFALLEKDRIDLRPSKNSIATWVYGICFAIIGVFLFAAYKSYSLAGIYPLLEGGVLVFLALDFLFHRKKIAGREALLLIAGVAIVFIGTYFAESTGLRFNTSALPYAVLLIVASGLGYYALANKTKRIGGGSKNTAFAIAAIVMGLSLLLIYHNSIFNSITPFQLLEAVAAGALLCVAFTCEMKGVRYAVTGDVRKDVILRNFINNFTELDTVIVLLASVLIGSYSYEALFGGALIIVGVLVLGTIK